MSLFDYLDHLTDMQMLLGLLSVVVIAYLIDHFIMK